MDIFPGNAQWIGQRHDQQDAFGFVGFEQTYFRTHAGVLAVVADGMGGLDNGREASQRALQVMLDAYRDKRPDEPIADALLRSLVAANAAVHELACATDNAGNVGTTLVAAAVCNGQLFWVSAGDSRLYLYRRADDSFTQCTQDHNLGNDLMSRVASGEISREAVEQHPDREALTSFLGLAEIPKVDRNLRPLRLDDGDRLLLCSDGISGVLSTAELKAALKQDAQAAAETLIAATQAKQLPRQDNATVAILAAGTGALFARRDEPPTRREAPLNQPRRRGRRWLILLAALLLIGLAVAVGFYLWGDPVRDWMDPGHGAETEVLAPEPELVLPEAELTLPGPSLSLPEADESMSGAEAAAPLEMGDVANERGISGQGTIDGGETTDEELPGDSDGDASAEDLQIDSSSATR